MEKIKVKIINSTGAVVEFGDLCLSSGLITIGESLTHIVSEKSAGKKVLLVKDEPVKPQEVIKDESPSLVQSPKIKTKKSKG